MKGNAKFEECRQMLNNVSTLSELEEVLKVYGKINNGEYYNYITINDWTIGWSYDNNSIYILSGKELIDYSKLSSGADPVVISFILDEVLKLDTDEFYKFFFKKYGYGAILSECKSKVVKDILNQFIKSKASLKNIFVSENYTSVTVSGIKRNGTDFECNIMYCDKSDIQELIELTRIKPHINRINNNIYEVYNRTERPHRVTNNEIMESYNDYKDSVYDQSISDDSIDDIIKITITGKSDSPEYNGVRIIKTQQDCICIDSDYKICIYDLEEDATWYSDNNVNGIDLYQSISKDIDDGKTDIDLSDYIFNLIKED